MKRYCEICGKLKESTEEHGNDFYVITVCKDCFNRKHTFVNKKNKTLDEWVDD